MGFALKFHNFIFMTVDEFVYHIERLRLYATLDNSVLYSYCAVALTAPYVDVRRIVVECVDIIQNSLYNINGSHMIGFIFFVKIAFLWIMC